MDPNQMAGTGQGSAAPHGGAAKTVGAVAVLAVVIVGGWYLYTSGVFGKSIEKAPEISREQLVGEQALTTTQTDAIAVHKQEILDRVASGKPLTEAERQSLGRTMLMEAHLYHFTEAETQAIYKAIQQQ